MFNNLKQFYRLCIVLAGFLMCFESLAQGNSSQNVVNRIDMNSPREHAREKLGDAKFKLGLKVIGCQKNRMPEYIDEDSVKHDACGDLDSVFLFNDTVDVYLTKESRFDNLRPVKILRTVPGIQLQKDKYKIQEQKIINTVDLGVEVFVKPTEIVNGKVFLDLAVRTRELADSEEIFLDSNRRSFINNGIGFKHRYLVASYPVSLNSAEILGGEAAVLSPRSEDLKSNDSYPEAARLWLEVKLMPPS